jgi:nicotinate-nucleotide pyrophosphorylase (carboxylating)
MLDRLLDLALEEDLGSGDWTSRWTVAPEASGEATVVAKEELVVAGTQVFLRVFERVDPGMQLEVMAPDGSELSAEDPVVRMYGSLHGILAGERVALNFLGRLSGVATLTRRFVKAVAGTSARILDTRKTTPGWRFLEKAAVRAGGGENHRMGLDDMVLIKDNHLVAAGGVIPAVRGVLESNDRGIDVEVEVGTLEELEEALSFGAGSVQRILLDNMAPDLMARAVRMVHERAPRACPPGRGFGRGCAPGGLRQHHAGKCAVRGGNRCGSD